MPPNLDSFLKSPRSGSTVWQPNNSWDRSSPVRTIQRAVLDGFGDVLALYLGGAFQVCNRARYFQDAVVSACAESLLVDGALQHPLAVGRELAVSTDLRRGHLRVRIQLLTLESLQLHVACPDNALADLV